MKRRKQKSEPRHLGCHLILILLCASLVKSFAATTITKTNYHGWPNSYVLSNGAVEAIVVPSIGRVMQFRFVGEDSGPFFENRAMDGKHPIPTSKEWGNFGGDKTWPAPQDDWPKITPRSWPPPVAFDSMPVEAIVHSDSITLVSPVDPHYGIRTERVISLGDKPYQMTIKTVYYKTVGEPRKVGIWIITQLNEPDDICIQNWGKWTKQSAELPLGFIEPKDERFSIHLKRDPVKATKIATHASHLYWHDKKWTLSITSPRIAGETYPDNGNSAEVYTNPNPLTYVELEMLGPIKELKLSDTISQTNVYSIGRHGEAATPDEESK